MASPGFIEYTFGIIGGFILGAVLTALIYTIYDWWNLMRLKKNIPTDLKTINAPGEIQLNEEEVKQNEREQLKSYREFEKLRELGIKSVKGGESKTGTKPTNTTGITSKPERIVLQDEPDSDTPRTEGSSRKKRKRIELPE